MEKINSQASLRKAILQLESKRAVQEKLLKDEFLLTYNSMKPINMVKSAFRELTQSSDLKDNVLNSLVGLTAGYISKLLFVGFAKNPVKKLIGSALMFGITNVVTKNPEVVKSLGKGLLKMISRKPVGRVHAI